MGSFSVKDSEIMRDTNTNSLNIENKEENIAENNFENVEDDRNFHDSSNRGNIVEEIRDETDERNSLSDDDDDERGTKTNAKSLLILSQPGTGSTLLSIGIAIKVRRDVD